MNLIVMYALVALGFVMIYKASGVFQLRPGRHGLSRRAVGGWLHGEGAPLWLAIILAFAIMTAFGIATEKFVLRKLVNQPPIALFMATIGLAFFIEGLAPMLFGSEPRALDLGIVDEPIAWFSMSTNMVIFQVRPGRGAVASVLVADAGAVLPIHPSAVPCARWRTTTRPPCRSAFRCRTSGPSSGVAGFVALVAGMMWGARNGVQFALTFTALKALPVLILGGFTSVPGAIVGGLIIGASEKLAEIYIPPVMQDLFGGNFGGIEGWFPIMALLFLLVRPKGCSAKTHRPGL